MRVEPASARAREPIAEERQSLEAVALVDREQSRSHKRGCPGFGRLRLGSLECGAQRVPALVVVAASEPEPPERGRELEGRRRIMVEEPLERGPEVVALGFESLERVGLSGTAHLALGVLAEGEVVAGVPVAQLVRLGSASRCSAANSRIVSSIHTRWPVRRTRLLSSSGRARRGRRRRSSRLRQAFRRRRTRRGGRTARARAGRAGHATRRSWHGASAGAGRRRGRRVTGQGARPGAPASRPARPGLPAQP